MGERAFLDEFAQGVAIARRSHRRGEVARLSAEKLEFGAGNDALEHGQRRAQPPQRHPHLMDGLGIVAFAQRRPVGDEMIDIAKNDPGDGFVENEFGRQRRWLGLDRARQEARGEAIGALGLADDVEPQGQALRHGRGKFIEVARFAGFQFQLDFAQRACALASDDLALVEGRLDSGGAAI